MVAKLASKSEAGGLDARSKQRRKVMAEPVMAVLPSLFPGASEMGINVPEETRVMMDAVSEEMKLF